MYNCFVVLNLTPFQSSCSSRGTMKKVNKAVSHNQLRNYYECYKSILPEYFSAFIDKRKTKEKKPLHILRQNSSNCECETLNARKTTPEKEIISLSFVKKFST